MLEWPVVAVSATTMVAALLIYAVTGAMGIDDTLGAAERLLFGGLCTMICWPVCHSVTATAFYLTRRLKPHVILIICAASILFMTIPCGAVGYTISGVFGMKAFPVSRIFINFGVWLAACSAVIQYTACLRARLRYTAEAALSDVHSAPQESPTAVPAKAPHGTDETGAPKERGDGDSPATQTHVASIKSAEDPIPEDGRLDGSPPPTEPAVAESNAFAGGDTGEDRLTSVSRAPTEPRSRFLDRLPEKLGRDVIYLNVSGHYVNAVTAEGSGVILMRFADAVAELGDVGMQVHRSYWVSYHHITGIFRRDERTIVRVTGGHELPVSRTHLSAVRALIPHIAKGGRADRRGA